MTSLPGQSGVIMISRRRARTHIVSDQVVLLALAVSGLAMGGFVARAATLRNAQFTALAGIPGWPTIWGLSLMAFGAVSISGRLITIRDPRGRYVVAAGMAGMSCWYLLFASSLVLGTAEYGFCPYYALAVLHAVYAVKAVYTGGFRPEALTHDQISTAMMTAAGIPR